MVVYQAEDGIRDVAVTGVQTCALPICCGCTQTGRVSSEEEPMKYVLFVCNHNAGRSQMARAFFDALAPPDIRAQSAGTEPATPIWPAVVEVMNEVGLDISDRRPKKLTREMQLHADLAVTMGCGDAC